MIKLKMVLLDAGHGGFIDGEYVTPGKRSPVWKDGTQYFEGVGNRLIRAEIIKLLKKEGIRYREVNFGDKDMPLKQRVEITNAYAMKYGVNATLLISIHSNGFSKESAHGWEVFTSPGKTKSDTYAEALYEEMKALFPDETFRTDTSDGDQDKEARFYMCVNTICPAILSENFFHTNERECKEILMNKCARKKIAQAHVNMIKRFV